MWQTMVRGCFGIVDMIFAGHPTEQVAAKEMIKTAKAAGATLEDVLKEVVWFLFNNNCGTDHIKTQVERVRKAW